jgi:hypothetical protein
VAASEVSPVLCGPSHVLLAAGPMPPSITNARPPEPVESHDISPQSGPLNEGHAARLIRPRRVMAQSDNPPLTGDPNSGKLTRTDSNFSTRGMSDLSYSAPRKPTRMTMAEKATNQLVAVDNLTTRASPLSALSIAVSPPSIPKAHAPTPRRWNSLASATLAASESGSS